MDAKTVCLGVLMNKKASGYEIKKTCSEGMFGTIHYISYGSIYPALSKLLEAKMVECEDVLQEGKPDKKIYSITNKGREYFIEKLHKKPQDNKYVCETLFMLVFAHLVSDTKGEKLYDDVINQHQKELNDTKKSMENNEISTPGMKFIDELGFAINNTIIDYLNKNKQNFLTEVKEYKNK